MRRAERDQVDHDLDASLERLAEALVACAAAWWITRGADKTPDGESPKDAAA
jgi:hypothetical protein